MKRNQAECVTLRVSALLLMMFCAASCGRDRRPLDVRLQAAVDDGLRKYVVKGASAALVFPDQSVRLAVGGVSHDTVPMRPDMLFAIGSITKNVVAALVFSACRGGALSLEDPLHKWLPAHPTVLANITIRQLLAHTSGLYMFWENQQIWDDHIKYREPNIRRHNRQDERIQKPSGYWDPRRMDAHERPGCWPLGALGQEKGTPRMKTSAKLHRRIATHRRD